MAVTKWVMGDRDQGLMRVDQGWHSPTWMSNNSYGILLLSYSSERSGFRDFRLLGATLNSVRPTDTFTTLEVVV